MKYAGIAVAIASPLVAQQLVAGIVQMLMQLHGLMMDCFPPDAMIVQSAITLTTAHGTVVAVLLAGYAVYMWQVKNKHKFGELLFAGAKAAALVAPVSMILFAK